MPPQASRDRVAVYSAGALLNRWCKWGLQNEVQISHLKDLQLLTIRARNSVNELTVVSAEQSEVLVRGGRCLSELTPMRLNDSALGSSSIRRRGKYAGFRLEFSLGGLDIFTTSPVEGIGPGEDPGEI
jgi:hypothetical protein